MAHNPFSLTFGKEPRSFITNSSIFDEIKGTYLSDNPVTTTNLITGVRGAGKTVLLTKISKYFEELDDWIVVELNPETDMLEYLAASIYEKSKYKFKFMDKEFSFSFKGISISLSGKNPISNVISLLERMLEFLTKKKKKILICIDDISNNQNVRVFVQQYQIFIRKNFPLFLLMTGLYENVRSLQNEKSLTFLYRAPQINVGPLSLINIADSFETILLATSDEAVTLAKLTNGYAFAYQVLGYILFEHKTNKVNEQILKEFDNYLRENVYEKIYFDLTKVEKQIVKALAVSKDDSIASVMKLVDMNKENMSQYREKLIRKGIIIKKDWGEISFALPRFKEYVLRQIKFE